MFFLILLVSSFTVSVLCGFYASIDPADGSGMNAMSLTQKTWVLSSPFFFLIYLYLSLKDREILDFVSPNRDLAPLLGPIQESYKPVGTISTYFQQRYSAKFQLSVNNLIHLILSYWIKIWV